MQIVDFHIVLELMETNYQLESRELINHALISSTEMPGSSLNKNFAHND